MSWVRWGSPCWHTVGFVFECDEACERCPGSSVYVYESGQDQFTCCCGDGEDQADFVGSDEQMVAHLKDHATRGDHVRPSLLLSDEERERANGRRIGPAEMMDRMHAVESARQRAWKDVVSMARATK